jgi:D-alanyl-D-alanine carboxypeptidase
MQDIVRLRAARFAALATIVAAGLGLAAGLPDSPETLPGPSLTPTQNGAWENPVPAPTEQALDATLSRAMSLPGTGAFTIAIRSATHGHWQSHAPTDARLFWWASSGKLVTTILALQEVQAGRLGMDVALKAQYPMIPENITLRHMLTHTSGIPDFARAGLLAGQYGLVERQALIRAALAEGRDFAPGDGWAYSNTGFLLVQALLEATTGASYESLVETRIAQPLGLAGFAAPADNVPAGVTLPALGTPRPASEFPPNIGGAGSVLATAEEMARFWQAAMAGDLVDTRLLQEAIGTLYPMFGSQAMQMGAGMILYPASDGRGYWLGHGGGAAEVNAIVLYSTDRQMILAVAGIGLEFQAMQVANLFIEALDQCEAGGC